MSAIGPDADPERSASILREWGIAGFPHIADDGRVGVLFDVRGDPGPDGYDDLIEAARAMDA